MSCPPLPRQSILSAGLKQMEERLCVLLIERSQRFRGLTPRGERVLEWANHVITDYNGLQQGLAEMRRGLAGQLRIVATPVTPPTISLLTTPFAQRHSLNHNWLPMTSDAQECQGAHQPTPALVGSSPIFGGLADDYLPCSRSTCRRLLTPREFGIGRA
jgi:hypothetical protein